MDLRRYLKHTKSQCNDIHHIIGLLLLCYSYRIYSICMGNIEHNLRMPRKHSIHFIKKKQYENLKYKPEHYKHVGCFKAQVCSAQPKEVPINPRQIQLACSAFCSASVRKHWAGAAWEGHGLRCFITKYAYCLHQKSLGRMIKHTKKNLTKKNHQVMHEKWDYGIRVKVTANMLTRKSLQS